LIEEGRVVLQVFFKGVSAVFSKPDAIVDAVEGVV
jgi:hypothetical protein